MVLVQDGEQSVYDVTAHLGPSSGNAPLSMRAGQTVAVTGLSAREPGQIAPEGLEASARQASFSCVWAEVKSWRRRHGPVVAAVVTCSMFNLNQSELVTIDGTQGPGAMMVNLSALPSMLYSPAFHTELVSLASLREAAALQRSCCMPAICRVSMTSAPSIVIRCDSLSVLTCPSLHDFSSVQPENCRANFAATVGECMRRAKNCCGARLLALMRCLVEARVAAKTWLWMRSVP